MQTTHVDSKTWDKKTDNKSALGSPHCYHALHGALEQLCAARKTFTDRIVNLNDGYMNRHEVIRECNEEISKIDDRMDSLIAMFSDRV